VYPEKASLSALALGHRLLPFLTIHILLDEKMRTSAISEPLKSHCRAKIAILVLMVLANTWRTLCVSASTSGATVLRARKIALMVVSGLIATTTMFARKTIANTENATMIA
jgi:hypothetical protein